MDGGEKIVRTFALRERKMQTDKLLVLTPHPSWRKVGCQVRVGLGEAGEQRWVGAGCRCGGSGSGWWYPGPTQVSTWGMSREPRCGDQGRKQMLFCVPKSFTIWLVPTDQNQDVVYRPQICSWEQRLPPMLLPPGLPAYLAVQAQKDEHHEEQGGPEWGEGHHGDGLWVGNKGQARAWRGSREKGAEWNSVPHSITMFI